MKIRRQRDRVLALHFVIAIPGIAPHRPVHLGLRQRGFDAQNCLPSLCRLRRSLASQREHLGYVFDQMLPHFRVLGIILDVIVPIRQCQSTLIHVCDHHVRVMQVRRGVEPEQAVRADHV